MFQNVSISLSRIFVKAYASLQHNPSVDVHGRQHKKFLCIDGLNFGMFEYEDSLVQLGC